MSSHPPKVRVWGASTHPLDILTPGRDLVPEIPTSGKDMGPEVPPPVVDKTCENITFPQLRWRTATLITTESHMTSIFGMTMCYFLL